MFDKEGTIWWAISAAVIPAVQIRPGRYSRK